jgi:cobalt-zinc-cadmium efflux system membrane fusion protein
MNALRSTVRRAAVVVMIGGLGGCGGAPSAPVTAREAGTVETSASGAPATAAHDHSGWWCDEHGVPEEECGQCDAKLAAAFQKKGDWCKEHDRPDSQCFICHPEKEAEFAARYEARYGKKPPRPAVN